MQASAPPATSAASAGFFRFPRELRNLIYEHVLVKHRPISLLELMKFADNSVSLSSQLLRTNKTIHQEANEVLYARNRFDLSIKESTPSKSNHLFSFLDQIGPDNAKHIRHIRVDFPTFESLTPSKVALTHDSIRILEKIKECCSNLRTLTTPLYTDDGDSTFDNLGHPEVFSEALKLVDTHFRAISSVKENESLEMVACQLSQTQLEPDWSLPFSTGTPIPLPNHNNDSRPLTIIAQFSMASSYDEEVMTRMKDLGWTLDIPVYLNGEDEDGGSSNSEFDDEDYDGDDAWDDAYEVSLYANTWRF